MIHLLRSVLLASVLTGISHVRADEITYIEPGPGLALNGP